MSAPHPRSECDEADPHDDHDQQCDGLFVTHDRKRQDGEKRDAAEKQAYDLILGDAGKVMKEFPDLRMEISGHTSSEGDATKNLKLSQDRSDAVRAYLISVGVAGDRIMSIGFGADKPVGDNKTSAGREKNRRIEFRLLTADDAKTPAGAGGAPASSGPPAAPALPLNPPKGPPPGEPMPAH